MTDTAILVVGLPGAGKSTFLGALWYALENPGPNSSLGLVDLKGDKSYLTDIRKSWLSCDPVARTAEGTSQAVELRLSVNGEPLIMAFPDHSGELFRDAINERVWPSGLDQLVGSCAGIALFVHSVEFDEPTSIAEAATLLVDEQPQTDLSDPPVQPFESDRIPTQAKLVDLLQLVASRADDLRPLAVIVSAWDRVPDDIEPGAWLADKLPLLAQYLENTDSFERIRIWGVSAQGGHYPTERESLLEYDVPRDRIGVDDSEAATTDISAPLAWLLPTAP